MKNCSFALICAVALLSFGGCKKKSIANEALAKLAELKDKMCACKDRACAESVQDTFTTWGKEQLKPNTPIKVSEDDSKKMATLSDEYGKCMLSAIGAPAEAAPGSGATGSATPSSGSAAPAAGSAAPSTTTPAAGSAAPSTTTPAAGGSAQPK